jgi:hypothetical protein
VRRSAVCVAVSLGAALAAPACAKGPFYLGVWKIQSAVAAPWANPVTSTDTAEMRSFIGKTVTLASKEISGPKVFACNGPHYKLSYFTADMLFEGQFGEMHDADKSKDPQKLATSLGFTGSSIMTLDTGCEIDWHFINPATAEIGLDDYVYTLKKQ